MATIMKIPQKFVYALDRANYEQRMAMSQVCFMLEYHSHDIDFLTSDLFKRLHKNLVTTTAQKWCSEVVVLKEMIGQVPQSYSIDIQNAKITMEV